MCRWLILGIALTGCKAPPEAPEGLDESTRYMVRNFYTGDATFEAGIHGFVDWFGDTGAPEQPAAIAIVRAVEHRRWLVRAANTGVSLIADPWGRVTTQSSLFRQEIIVGRIRPRGDETPYTRYGDWVVYASALVTICGLLGSRREFV